MSSTKDERLETRVRFTVVGLLRLLGIPLLSKCNYSPFFQMNFFLWSFMFYPMLFYVVPSTSSLYCVPVPVFRFFSLLDTTYLHSKLQRGNSSNYKWKGPDYTLNLSNLLTRCERNWNKDLHICLRTRGVHNNSKKEGIGGTSG